MDQRQEAKVDRLLEGLAALVPQVATNKENVRDLLDEVVELKEGRAGDVANYKNLRGDVDSIGDKIRKHIAAPKLHAVAAVAGVAPPIDSFKSSTIRWKWLASVAIALTAIVGLVIMLAPLAGR